MHTCRVLAWYCFDMQIRHLREDDIPAVAALLAALAQEFIVRDIRPEDAARFTSEHDAAGLRRNLDAGMVYHVADVDGDIAGFIAMRDRRHLYHMFVGKRWQRQGIARALWQAARAQAEEAEHDGVFTVNSSNYAVGVYQAFGFRRTMPVQVRDGLPYNPMQFNRSDACENS